MKRELVEDHQKVVSIGTMILIEEAVDKAMTFRVNKVKQDSIEKIEEIEEILLMSLLGKERLIHLHMRENQRTSNLIRLS